ncbi:MAG TPA: twin-arginine translocase subunit TatC [Gemmatimonadales bacterium]|nr:twin-arginine translocase subunit TatC [Gemmatimonadales bacterium]
MQATEAFDGGKPMTLLEHLLELRSRLIWCALALVVAVIISSIFTSRVMLFLVEPAKEQAPDFKLIVTEPMENITVFFRVALLGGLILAMPMFIYQTLMFVLPALTPQEKKWVFPLVVGILASFLIGVAFSFYVILPPSANVLFNFNSGFAEPNIKAGSYIDFVTRLLFWVGLTFEMPIFILALARFGMITGRRLLGWWRFAIVGAFLLSAIITPTIDPVTQSLVAGPIIVLWLVGTGLAFLFGRPR